MIKTKQLLKQEIELLDLLSGIEYAIKTMKEVRYSYHRCGFIETYPYYWIVYMVCYRKFVRTTFTLWTDTTQVLSVDSLPWRRMKRNTRYIKITIDTFMPIVAACG